jgi:hypothetical protein
MFEGNSPCRFCTVSKSDLSSRIYYKFVKIFIEDFDIVANAKTAEFIEHIRRKGGEMLRAGVREKFLDKYGLEEEGTPLQLLNTLILPTQVLHKLFNLMYEDVVVQITCDGFGHF